MRLLLVQARSLRHRGRRSNASLLRSGRRRWREYLGGFSPGERGERKRRASCAGCRRRLDGELAVPASVSPANLRIFIVLIRANLEQRDIDERLF